MSRLEDGNSLVGHLSGMPEALGSILAWKEKEGREEGKRGVDPILCI